MSAKTQIIPIVRVKRGADRYLCRGVTAKGEKVDAEITEEEYRALGEAGDNVPKGVDPDDWHAQRVVAYGGVPDYGGKEFLEPGEVCDMGDCFKLGLPAKDGFRRTLSIPKDDLTDAADFSSVKVAFPERSKILSLTPTSMEVVE